MLSGIGLITRRSQAASFQRLWNPFSSSFCSKQETKEGAGDPIELRKLLRKFYVKVHPDLFSSYPKEQMINQNSLKELTTFTQEWCRNTSQSTFLPKTSTTIEFYLRKKKKDTPEPNANASDPIVSEESKEIESKDQGNETFHHHKMTLISNGSFSEVKAQYVRLFEQAGLPTTFSVGGKSSEVADFQFMDEFLVNHKEAARENVKKEEKASQLVKELIFKFKHHQDITIYVGNGFENYFNFENVNVLENLRESMDSMKRTNPEIVDALKGAIIGFDSPSSQYAADYEQGILFVDREGSPIEYIRHFRSVDIPKLRQGIERRGKQESDEQQELKHSQNILEKFGKQIGIKSIEMAEKSSFYSDDYQVNEDGKEKLPYNYEKELKDYHSFAKNIRDHHKVISRPWQKGKMKQVPVWIRNLLDDKEYFISNTPALIISPKVSPSKFVELINKYGPTVNVRIQEMNHITNSIHFIMARMGLESLNVQYIMHTDPDGHRKAVSAVKKLEQVAGELRKFDLSGLSLGIDNQYNVEADGTLWIKWNFQMETLKKLMGKINEKREEEKQAKLQSQKEKKN